MYILGINAYHAGASACLIRDGDLVAAAEEERFSRIKYCAGFPAHAIQFCLGEAGISAYDLDHVALSKDPGANLTNKIAYLMRGGRPSLKLIRDRVVHMTRTRDIRRAFCEAVNADLRALKCEFHNVEHHRAHLASAFFVSPFRDAALLSVDGFGDFVSTMIGRGVENRIDPIATINYPHSLGIFFTAITQWLGFPKFGDEGKIQGLAAFGQPVYADDLRELLRLGRCGTFELDLDYFVHWAQGADMTWSGGSPELGKIYSARFVERFGQPRRCGAALTEEYVNMAASAQAVLEEAEFHVVRDLHARTGLKRLCMAGGVALNSSFNGKIISNTGFTEVYIQPAANDAGTALGAAYYIHHQVLDNPRKFTMTSSYTGPQFLNGTLEAGLKRYRLNYEPLDFDAIAVRTAELLANGNVVGWFQGRMEWGPRALGNRSILADPRRADMKEILNSRIKHREAFRPFAPSVLSDAIGDYFAPSYPDPFMLKVYEVREHRRAEIPAVTHVDGTGRVQTVDRSANPLYWQLIREFANRTDVPLVLNTSFNENEPIVCRPEEAIQCLLRTKMDALAIGNYLVSK